MARAEHTCKACPRENGEQGSIMRHHEDSGFLLPQEWCGAPSRGSPRRGAQWRAVCAAAANQYPRIPLSLLIRSFIGGWVANMAEEKPLRGFTTNMCDTASFTFIGLR